MGGGGYNRRNLARAWTRVVESFLDSEEQHQAHREAS
jgi:acetoin utilization deacetylase AcuC-like enzyme